VRGTVRPVDLALVAVGGVVGSLTRYAVGLALPGAPGGWPWATLVVNLAASLVIGLVAGRQRWLGGPHWVRPLLMSGVLGGLSTYSAFAVDTVALREGAGLGAAAAYVVITLVASVSSAALGTVVAQRIWGRDS